MSSLVFAFDNIIGLDNLIKFSGECGDVRESFDVEGDNFSFNLHLFGVNV